MARKRFSREELFEMTAAIANGMAAAGGVPAVTAVHANEIVNRAVLLLEALDGRHQDERDRVVDE